MSNYVDGFVFPVPRSELDEYRQLAEAASAIWIEHGAVQYCEFVGDDLAVEGTKSFNELTQAADDEVVILAWALYQSREARDAANEKIMSDPRMADILSRASSLVDFQRMGFGGFRSLISART